MSVHFERDIYEDKDRFFKIVVSVSEFHDKMYLNIRKQFLSFEGEYIPSKEGVSMPFTLETTSNVFRAFAEILSSTESEKEMVRIIDERKKLD